MVFDDDHHHDDHNDNDEYKLSLSIFIYYKLTGSAKGFNFGLSFLQDNLTTTTEPMYHIDTDNNKFIVIHHNDYDDPHKSNTTFVSSAVGDRQSNNHSHHHYHHRDDDNDNDDDDDDSKWVLIVNNDIAFYPHTLKQITITVQKQLSHLNSRNATIGFTNLCCGSEWSAVIFTKRLVNKVRIYRVKNEFVHKHVYHLHHASYIYIHIPNKELHHIYNDMYLSLYVYMTVCSIEIEGKKRH